MPYKSTKHAFVWIGGLIIIATTAYGASRLYAPKPPISEEQSAGQRVCDKINDLMAKTGGTIDPSLTVAVCIEANKDCENRLGPHSIWAGAADVNNVPHCDCDDGYHWATDGSGKCVAWQ
ncbi:MAG: hypothetical protein WC798_02855 [Candidatus Paceibacterota bacterium]|jgi:hypothetical protein